MGSPEAGDLVHPLVVHFKQEPYDVYVGRPGPWGNPFSDGTREENCARYIEWLNSQPGLIARAQEELQGKVLGCWCAPHQCHGDTLARIANDEPMAMMAEWAEVAEWAEEFLTSGVGWPD
jgi:hypothetical protein